MIHADISPNLNIVAACGVVVGSGEEFVLTLPTDKYIHPRINCPNCLKLLEKKGLQQTDQETYRKVYQTY